jgi:general secretion pathway protein F
MNTFSYKAYDSEGVVVDGQIDAETLIEAKNILVKKKLKPVSVAIKTTESSNSLSFLQNKSVTLDDIEFITAELSLLLDSGVKIDKALAVLAKAKSGSPLSDLLTKLTNDVRKGLPLSTAMQTHDKHFDKLYINLVMIGESSGNLPEVFAGLAKDLKYRKELKSKITQAITYPAVIFFVCVISVLFIFNFIVPKLSVMFADSAELPYYTEVLLGVSNWIQSYQIHLLAFIIIGVVAMKWALNEGYFANKFDEILLYTPLLKTTVSLIERIRFSSSMALMLGAGVKLDQALDLSVGSIKNDLLTQNLSKVRDKVRKGDSITVSLAQSHFFPNLYMSLIEVGEESGNMATVFDEIANRSRTQFNHWTERMTSLIEPLMILFMGGIVGTVVVVMLMSIVSVNEIGF